MKKYFIGLLFIVGCRCGYDNASPSYLNGAVVVDKWSESHMSGKTYHRYYYFGINVNSHINIADADGFFDCFNIGDTLNSEKPCNR